MSHSSTEVALSMMIVDNNTNSPSHNDKIATKCPPPHLVLTLVTMGKSTLTLIA
jgi:hypothetical protein